MAGTSAKKRTRKPPALDTSGFDFDSALGDLEADSGRKIINDDGTINPVKIGQEGRTPNELVELFELDGRKFYVPSKPSPALMQRFLRDVRKRGNATATAILLDTMIGEEALDALAESPDVSDADMAGIYTIVTHIAFGKVAKKVEAGQDPS